MVAQESVELRQRFGNIFGAAAEHDVDPLASVRVKQLEPRFGCLKPGKDVGRLRSFGAKRRHTQGHDGKTGQSGKHSLQGIKPWGSRSFPPALVRVLPPPLLTRLGFRINGSARAPPAAIHRGVPELKRWQVIE